MKNRVQQEARAPENKYIPKWKYLLNWDNVIQIHSLQSIPPQPPWRADKCPIYVIKYPEPKYVLCPPKNAPRRAQKRETVSKHPRNAVSGIVDTCLQVPSIPPNSAAPGLPTPPSYPAPSAGQPFYPLTQRTLLPILVGPAPRQDPFFTIFLAGGQLPV